VKFKLSQILKAKNIITSFNDWEYFSVQCSNNIIAVMEQMNLDQETAIQLLTIISEDLEILSTKIREENEEECVTL
jgi:hypothetical protein